MAHNVISQNLAEAVSCGGGTSGAVMDVLASMRAASPDLLALLTFASRLAWLRAAKTKVIAALRLCNGKGMTESVYGFRKAVLVRKNDCLCAIVR